MSENKKNIDVIEECKECQALKEKIKNLELELKKYRIAYEQLSNQNSNLWGLYSNTVDYIVAQTTKSSK